MMIRVLVVIAMLLAWSTPADAERSASATKRHARAQAERSATRAKAHFDAGQYAAAAIDYGEAYRTFPSPGLLYNLAQAYRLVGDCGAATAIYHHYLRRVPGSRHRKLVRRHLADLEPCRRRSSAPTRAAGIVSFGTAGDAPLVGPPRRRGAGRAYRVAGIVTAGVGAALAGFGLYFTLDAEEADATSRGRGHRDDAALEARGDRSAMIGATLLTTGVAAGIGGVALYAIGWRADRDGPAMTVGSLDDGLQLKVSWRF